MIEKVLSFTINGSLFGIRVMLIKEINRNVEFTIVPDSKPHIVGLFNMRGQVVTLFDLVKLLGLKEDVSKTKTTCVILKSMANDPNQFGFLIDDLGGVIDVDSENCESPPANVVGIECDYISSVVKLEDQLLMILEPSRVSQQNI
jgi:purine-binding chemotaxis protein CheW